MTNGYGSFVSFDNEGDTERKARNIKRRIARRVKSEKKKKQETGK